MKLENKQRVLLSAGTLLLGIGMIAAGVFREEVDCVFLKAVNICFECIGLG